MSRFLTHGAFGQVCTQHPAYPSASPTPTLPEPHPSPLCQTVGHHPLKFLPEGGQEECGLHNPTDPQCGFGWAGDSTSPSSNPWATRRVPVCVCMCACVCPLLRPCQTWAVSTQLRGVSPLFSDVLSPSLGPPRVRNKDTVGWGDGTPGPLISPSSSSQGVCLGPAGGCPPATDSPSRPCLPWRVQGFCGFLSPSSSPGNT